MKKDEIIKYMKEGLDSISDLELAKIFQVLLDLNKALNALDSKRQNKLDEWRLALAVGKKAKSKVLIDDIFDKYREDTDVQKYSIDQNRKIQEALLLMKLYIETDGWDRLWAILGIS